MKKEGTKLEERFDVAHEEWVEACIRYSELQDDYVPLSYEKEHAWIKKWYRNEIKKELQQERERIVNDIEEIPTHIDEGQGAVGRYGNKIIKVINQDHE
jgi:hypothetical protein